MVQNSLQSISSSAKVSALVRLCLNAVWQRAEQRRMGRIKISDVRRGYWGQTLALTPKTLKFPAQPSSARNRKAALTSARLLFGYFIFAKQNKVTSRRATPGLPA